jgi:hypothetical protein
MKAYSFTLGTPRICAAALFTALMTTACVSEEHTTPQQVQSSNPTVSYQYRNDDELIQANQRAAVYCDQYRYGPRTVRITNESNGSKMVVFECVQTAAQAPVPIYNSNLVYNYRSDQELMNATWNARMSCLNGGSQRVVSNIVANSDGSKTVTFRCMA